MLRFDDHAAFDEALRGGRVEPGPDGLTLLQEYVAPAQPFITRAEFVGGRFVYAVRVATTQGFELCPADACDVSGGGPLFELRKDYQPPHLQVLQRFLDLNGIEVAGIEYIESADGRVVTYDVNTNTNYNPDVDAQAEKSAPAEIARFLGRLASER